MEKFKLIDILLESNEIETTEQAFLKGVLTGAKDAKSLKTLAPEVHAAFNDVLKFNKGVNSNRQIMGIVPGKGANKIAITNIDDLIKAINKGLEPKEWGKLYTGFLKSGKSTPSMVAEAARDLIKNPTFTKKYSKFTPSQFSKELKTRGYSDEAIKELTALSKTDNTFKSARQTYLKTANKSKAAKSAKEAKIIELRNASSFEEARSILSNSNPSLVRHIDNVVEPLKKSGIVKRVLGSITRIAFWKIFPWKTLLALCLLGWVAWEIWDAIYGDTIPVDPDNGDGGKRESDWVRCILVPLLDDEGATLEEVNGQVGLRYTKTDNPDYDSKGGLVFFPAGDVVYGDNSRRGQWSCGSSGELFENEISINEQSGEVSQSMISKAIDALDDNLSGDWFDTDSEDMVDALQTIKPFVGRTYKGKDAIKLISHNYSKIVGGDLVTDVKSKLTNLDFIGVEAQEELLGILGVSTTSKETDKSGDSKDVTPDGNKNTGLSHLTITWASDDQGGGGGGGEESTKISYIPCGNFPFTLGCINDKIKEVQDCLGLKTDGYLGPITMKAIRDGGRFAGMAKEELTKEIFDAIITACKGREKVEPLTKLEPKKITSFDLPKLNPVKMIQLHGVDKLCNQINKTIDGEKIEDIIANQIEFRGGKYRLKTDVELTESQLVAINRYMTCKGYYLDKKRETLNKSRYVWVTDDKTARKISRVEKQIDKRERKINNLKGDE
jgi:hypothetical protein